MSTTLIMDFDVTEVWINRLPSGITHPRWCCWRRLGGAQRHLRLCAEKFVNTAASQRQRYSRHQLLRWRCQEHVTALVAVVFRCDRVKSVYLLIWPMLTAKKLSVTSLPQNDPISYQLGLCLLLNSNYGFRRYRPKYRFRTSTNCRNRDEFWLVALVWHSALSTYLRLAHLQSIRSFVCLSVCLLPARLPVRFGPFVLLIETGLSTVSINVDQQVCFKKPCCWVIS
jgi:hypothetical protein